MSFNHRPRAVINGVRRTRTYRFFWCRQCDRTVRIASSSDPHTFLCPLCYNLLCQELHITRSVLTLQQGEPSSSTASQLLDTMAHILEPPPPTRPTPWTPSRPVSPPEYALSRPENNPIRHSPPPQTTEFLPVVRVTTDILNREPTCPVCKEDFMCDEQIRQMPCNHFYHSDCIITWLQMNNTCPVCRYTIQVLQNSENNSDNNQNQFQAANYYIDADNNNNNNVDDFRIEDVMNLSWPSWAELFSLWPFSFRSFLNWSFHDHDDIANEIDSNRTGKLLVALPYDFIGLDKQATVINAELERTRVISSGGSALTPISRLRAQFLIICDCDL